MFPYLVCRTVLKGLLPPLLKLTSKNWLLFYFETLARVKSPVVKLLMSFVNLRAFPKQFPITSLTTSCSLLLLFFLFNKLTTVHDGMKSKGVKKEGTQQIIKI